MTRVSGSLALWTQGREPRQVFRFAPSDDDDDDDDDQLMIIQQNRLLYSLL